MAGFREIRKIERELNGIRYIPMAYSLAEAAR